MSTSAKKKTKDRNDETSSVAKQSLFVLEAQPTVVTPRNKYVWSTNENLIQSNELYGALRPADWEAWERWQAGPVGAAEADSPVVTRKELLMLWRRCIHRQYDAVSCYPYHMIHAELAPVPGWHGETSEFDTVADLIRRFIVCYSTLCSSSHPPSEDYSVLLGRTVWVSGYDVPLVEKKDETFFVGSSSSGVKEEDEEEGPRSAEASQSLADDCSAAAAESPTAVNSEKTFAVHTNVGSDHILVCSGLGFYRIRVLDPSRRCIRPAAQIAQDLQAVRAHSQRKCEELAALGGLSDAARADLIAGCYLVASLGLLDEGAAADLSRRLRSVSRVNAHSLAAIESPLFTVVLSGALGVRHPPLPVRSSWLRSCLTLCATSATEFTLRSPAAVVPMATLQKFLQRCLKHDMAADEGCSSGSGSNAHYGAEEGAAAAATAGASEASGELCEEVHPGLDHLPLWLPLKHRIALQPFPTAAPTPLWCPLINLSAPGAAVAEPAVSLAELCLAVVLATERALAASGGGASAPSRRPRVLFGAHNPQCPTPTFVLLYSGAVEEYIRVARGVSALLGPHTKADLRRAALESVRSLVHHCTHTCSLTTTFEPATVAGGEPSMPQADVCITANMLSQVYMRGNYGHRAPADLAARREETELMRVNAFQSFLGSTARAYITTTVEEVLVRKDAEIENGSIKEVRLGITELDEEFAIRVRANVQRELLEVRKK